MPSSAEVLREEMRESLRELDRGLAAGEYLNRQALVAILGGVLDRLDRAEGAPKPSVVTVETSRIAFGGDGEKWHARIAERPECWNQGESEAEAIGLVFSANPEIFGAVVTRVTP